MNDEASAPRPAVSAQVVPFSGPVVDLATIERIQTYQVMEHELEQLDTVISEENQALGFFTGLLGICLSVVVSMVTSFPTNPVGAGVVVGLAFVTLTGTLWSFLSWRRVRLRRPRLLAMIRGRLRQPNAAGG